jgi:hypothetical protein
LISQSHTSVFVKVDRRWWWIVFWWCRNVSASTKSSWFFSTTRQFSLGWGFGSLVWVLTVRTDGNISKGTLLQTQHKTVIIMRSWELREWNDCEKLRFESLCTDWLLVELTVAIHCAICASKASVVLATSSSFWSSLMHIPRRSQNLKRKFQITTRLRKNLNLEFSCLFFGSSLTRFNWNVYLLRSMNLILDNCSAFIASTSSRFCWKFAFAFWYKWIIINHLKYLTNTHTHTHTHTHTITQSHNHTITHTHTHTHTQSYTQENFT